MKRCFCCLSAVLLSIIFYIGCVSPDSFTSSFASSSAPSQITSFATSLNSSSVPSSSSAISSLPASEPNSKSSIPFVTEQPVKLYPGYFILVDDLLVGYYKNGQWYSADDKTIYINDLLRQNEYYCYNQTGLIGISKKLTFCYSDDLGDSFWEDGRPLIPYAQKHNDEDELITFDLPFGLPQNLRYLRSEIYNTNIDFNIKFPSDENHSIPLTLSTDFNPLPKSEVKKITGPFSDEDKAAVKAELERLDVPGAPINITECYEYDIEDDGITEHFVLAKTPENENGYGIVSPEEYKNDSSGFYYVVLCKDETGYETVVSWSYPYLFSYHEPDEGPDVTADQGIRLVGIFDLNNDGIFELCFSEPGWEYGRVFVYSLNEHNEWDRILTGYYGM